LQKSLKFADMISTVGENTLEIFVMSVQKFAARKCVTSIVQKSTCQEINSNVHSAVANSTLNVIKDSTLMFTRDAQMIVKIMFHSPMKMIHI
jgi:Tfp pilus assembly PilM family ATPase